MSPLSVRRILTALTLVILLCAAPALAAAPRTVRTAHAVPAPTQLSIVDFFHNAIGHFIAKITTSNGGSGGGGIGGARIDPNGAPAGPGGTQPSAGTP